MKALYENISYPVFSICQPLWIGIKNRSILVPSNDALEILKRVRRALNIAAMGVCELDRGLPDFLSRCVEYIVP